MSTADAHPLQGLQGKVEQTPGLADQAYGVLRGQIIGGEIPPGTPLSVPEVARRLGISRSPAREAIARIVSDGLARSEPRRGASVAAITLRDLRELYELREVLEGLACRLAAERVDACELVRLSEIVDSQDRALASKDIAKTMEADQAFHQTIRELSSNGRLIDWLGQLQGQVLMGMSTTRRRGGGMPLALAEHRKICGVLHERNPDTAEQAMRSHIRRLRTELLSVEEAT